MKLRNKLLLSCAALAACATTMVSTTFAWYTSNTEVTASGATTSTAVAGDSTLLISLTGNKGTWGSSVTLDTKTQELKPVSYGMNGAGQEAGNSGTDKQFYTFNPSLSQPGPDGTTATKGTDYLEFDLYLKNPSSATNQIYVKTLEIKNETSTPQPKDILSAGAAGLTGIKVANTTTYTMDLLRATNLIVTSETVLKKDMNGDGAGTLDPQQEYILDTTSYHDDFDYNDSMDPKGKPSGAGLSDGAGKNEGTVTTSPNAHTYYEEVTGKTLAAHQDITARTVGGSDPFVLTNAPLTQDKLVHVNFKLFLNGWDIHCFDACQGQKLSITLAFTTVAESAMTLNA